MISAIVILICMACLLTCAGIVLAGLGIAYVAYELYNSILQNKNINNITTN